MKMIRSFDPSLAANGTIDPQVANPCGRIYLFNESSVGLSLEFQNGDIQGLPPWYYRSFEVAAIGMIKWTQAYTLTYTGDRPASMIWGESYERVEAEKIQWTEGPLPRLTGVGNTVDTNVSGTNSVSNDGNPTGTVFVEATEVGNASGSNVAIRNDGSAIFAQFVSSVFKQIFKIVPGASPSVVVGKGTTLNIIDNNDVSNPVLLVDQADNNVQILAGATGVIKFADNAGSTIFATLTDILKFYPGTKLNAFDNSFNDGDILFVDSSGNTVLQAHPTNGQVILNKSDGSVLATFDSNGCMNLSGNIQTVNGDTSGTMTIQEIFAGGIKVTVVKQNNYRQNGAAQSFTLKNAFTGPYFIFNGGCGGMQMFNGGSNQQGNYFATVAAGGGTHTNQTASQQDTFGWQNNATDAVQSQGGYASAHTGVFVMIGF